MQDSIGWRILQADKDHAAIVLWRMVKDKEKNSRVIRVTWSIIG